MSFFKKQQLPSVDDISQSCSTLSSSLNLANKEFNQLPRIQIELVGMRRHKQLNQLPESVDALTEMCMNWLALELSTERMNSVASLCENLNMLYINDM